MYSNKIISEEVYADCDVERTLTAVKNGISHKPVLFHVFLGLLKNTDPIFDPVRNKLMENFMQTAKLKLKIEHNSRKLHLKLNLVCPTKWKHYDRILKFAETEAESKYDRDTLVFLINYDRTCPDISIQCAKANPTGEVEFELKWSNNLDSYITFYTEQFQIIEGHGQHCCPVSHDICRVDVTYEIPRAMCSEIKQLNLTYTDDLRHDSRKCRTYSRQYRGYIMDGSSVPQSEKLTEQVKGNHKLNPAFKAYCMSYHGIVLIHAQKAESSIPILKQALSFIQSCYDGNSILVRMRTHRILAKAYRTLRENQQAEHEIQQCNEGLSQAAPSCETAICFLEHAMILQNKVGSRVDREQVKVLISTGQKHILACKDRERRDYTIPMGNIDEALFRLHAFEEPPPTSIDRLDLREAKFLLKEVEESKYFHSKTGGKPNVYTVRLEVAKAHLCYYEEDVAEASRLIKEALKIMSDNEIANERNFNIKAKLKMFKDKIV